ncbi:hypothetical protein [Mycolicibacterium iranicum]|nr:hypothetical protein [Mycolicibacterium iranicum]
MDEAETWRGAAQTAATAMFLRATDRASAFKDYTERVASNLQRGGALIANYRTPLLSKAAEIDAGPLNVSDQRVVFIDPAGCQNVALPYGDRGFSVWIAVAGVLIGLPSLKQILLKRGMSYLLLSSNSFEVGNTISSVTHAWDDLLDVSDTPTGRARPANTGTTYLTMTDGRTRMFPSDWYTPGGCELRKLIHFYWRHPENRGELDDGRALARLQGLR